MAKCSGEKGRNKYLYHKILEKYAIFVTRDKHRTFVNKKRPNKVPTKKIDTEAVGFDIVIESFNV